ncbi:MAG: outer membrane beta-barrel protein [Flavobacteriaceae bacterium]|jgi:hypothetical protein|nr:outer membrane beta-barrel protein [Flavobacteriaceae bacterium]
MKKLLLTLALALFLTNTSTAQDFKKYIGVSIGAAIPQGDLADAAKTGLDLGLINAGYRFNETWGATVNWGATSHASKEGDVTIGVGYFAVGPMISFGDFDFKPQYAFSSVSMKSGGMELDEDVESAWIIGATYNYSLGGNWGLAANLDYFTFTIEDAEDSDSIMKFSVGVQYKF